MFVDDVFFFLHITWTSIRNILVIKFNIFGNILWINNVKNIYKIIILNIFNIFIKYTYII